MIIRGISTHAFAEGDVIRMSEIKDRINFNSRLRGRRRYASHDIGTRRVISTHAFAEGDTLRFYQFIAHLISTHAFAEGDSKFK